MQTAKVWSISRRCMQEGHCFNLCPNVTRKWMHDLVWVCLKILHRGWSWTVWAVNSACYVLKTTTTVLRPFVWDYPGEPVPEETLTHPPSWNYPIFISFFRLPRSIASSLFKLCAWQSFCTTSLHVLFGLPLGLEPSTSYSRHFFTQSVSSFRSTCPYHCSLFCCSILYIILPSVGVYALTLYPARADCPAATDISYTSCWQLSR